MDNKPFKFTNNKQFEYLYTTMEENLHIARGDAIASPDQEDLKDFWENLADILNKIGPLVRSASGWLKIWNEHKCFILKKIQIHPRSVEGQRKLIVLTDLEKGVAQIVNPRSYSILPHSSTMANGYGSSTAIAQMNGMQYRIKVRAAGEKSIMEESMASRIPKSAKETIAKIQEETHRYLQRMTLIEEERLKLEKRELEEKIKFREELALLVQKVKTDINVNVNF